MGVMAQIRDAETRVLDATVYPCDVGGYRCPQPGCSVDTYGQSTPRSAQPEYRLGQIR
jgi:hypothetical protein